MRKLCLSVFILLISTGFGSCKDDENRSCGQTKKIERIPSQNTVFYRDSIPQNSTSENYIIYNSQKNESNWYIFQGSIRIKMQICNLPEEAKKWENNTAVIINGYKHVSSVDHGIQPAIYSYYDFVITELKKN